MEFTPREIELRDGTRAVLREAVADDAAAMLVFLRDEVARSPYVLTVPEEATYTLEQETAWIEERSADPRSLWMLAFVGNEIVGASSLFASTRSKTRHTADLGTTVAAAWRDRGVGRAMLEALVEWARANPEVLRVTLDVMAPNERARRMYEGVGFGECGRDRRGYRQPDGTFVDGIRMDMWVG